MSLLPPIYPPLRVRRDDFGDEGTYRAVKDLALELEQFREDVVEAVNEGTGRGLRWCDL